MARVLHEPYVWLIFVYIFYLVSIIITDICIWLNNDFVGLIFYIHSSNESEIFRFGFTYAGITLYLMDPSEKILLH